MRGIRKTGRTKTTINERNKPSDSICLFPEKEIEAQRQGLFHPRSHSKVDRSADLKEVLVEEKNTLRVNRAQPPSVPSLVSSHPLNSCVKQCVPFQDKTSHPHPVSTTVPEQVNVYLL